MLEMLAGSSPGILSMALRVAPKSVSRRCRCRGVAAARFAAGDVDPTLTPSD